jgi:hypothetical protein
VRTDRPAVSWSAEERGILDDSRRSNRLQNVYSARDNRELASRYDEWAEDYEDDMLSLGYAIPAVAAGFVGRYVPLGGRVLDAGAGTGLFGGILRVLGYEDLVGIDISERMLEKAGEKDAYHRLHRMALGDPWVSTPAPSRPPSAWGSSQRTTPRLKRSTSLCGSSNRRVG